VHPALPPGASGREARYVFRELLVARGLIARPKSLGRPPRPHAGGAGIDAARLRPARAAQRRTAVQAHGSGVAVPSALSAGIVLLALAGAVLVRRVRRPSPGEAEPEGDARP
jgi:hypothetical protein